MTDNNEPQHRTYHQSDPERTFLRESDDEGDGVFTVRMPIASTGEVRNEGDEPLTRENLEGMADQVREGGLGVFLDHGNNVAVSGSRYSATGKVGDWRNPELVDGDDGEDLLEADARMMDPESLSEATGPVRAALATIKAQVDRGIGLSSSIGWRDDSSSPGGVDLMETSIVGIPADPRTTSNTGVAAARSVMMGSDEERHLSGQQADIAERLVADYRDDQGNGSVENFESWLWNVAYYQYDDSDFHAAQTALQEFYRRTTPLQEPVDEQFVPYLSNQGGTDDGDSSESADDEGESARETVTDDETDPDNTHEEDGMDSQEYRESMLEMQRQQTETLSTLAEALREDDDDGDDEEEDDEDNENSASVDERTVMLDGEERSVEEALDDLREQADSASAVDGESQTTDRSNEGEEDGDADETNRETTDDETSGFGFAGVEDTQ